MLAFTECVKCFSVVDYRVVVNVPSSLSFNFSRVDLLFNKWCSLLSILIGTFEVSMCSR